MYCEICSKSSSNLTQGWKKQMWKFQFCSSPFFLCFFLSFFLSFSHMHNSKTTGCIWMLYIPNNCSIIGNVPFQFRATSELQLVSYGPEQAPQSLSDTSFCVHFSKQLEKYRVYTNVLHIKQLLYDWVCSFCGVQMHGRSNWQAMVLNTYCSLSPICHLVFFKHNSKPTVQLQFYYTENNSSIIKDTSFHIEST